MRASLRLWVLAFLAALVATASGCAGAGQVQSSPTASEPVAATDPAVMPSEWSSPPVPTRLVVIGAPVCELLTRSELLALDLDPDSVEDHSNVDTADCRWSGKSSDRFKASLTLSNVRGLEAAYYVRDTFTYFEPTEIAGYPAVQTTSPEQWGKCELLLGVGPNRSIGSGAVGNRGRDYCALSRRLLEVAIPKLTAE